MVSQIELFESSAHPSPYLLYIWSGLIKSEVYTRNVDTRDALHARFLDAAARIKECEDQLIGTTRDLPTQAAKCIEAECRIFKQWL